MGGVSRRGFADQGDGSARAGVRLAVGIEVELPLAALERREEGRGGLLSAAGQADASQIGTRTASNP
jgi:hypothetical protein